MGKDNVTRRDFLKLMGIFGLTIPPYLSLNNLTNLLNTSQTRPNFIILLFDTLSARHLSLYGYPRNTSSQIEKFANQSTVFHRHYAAANHTKPNTASILTGTLPWSHRAINFHTSALDIFKRKNIFSELDPQIYYSISYTHNTHVATLLNQFGSDIDLPKQIQELTIYNPNKLSNLFKNDFPMGFYATKRWRDNYMGPSSSLLLNPIFMLRQAIMASNLNSAYSSMFPHGLDETQEGYLYKLEDSIDWIIQIALTAKKPYLGYFHLLPPHEAYKPRKGYFDLFADDKHFIPKKPDHFFSDGITSPALEEFCQRYDEYIAFVDSEFGRLYHTLQENGSLENTYLILTSDHGQLFERGIHGHSTPTMYESLIHIPLLIQAPGQTQRVDVRSPTSIVDILPTIMKLANQDVPDWCEGRILPKLGGDEDRERLIFSIDGKKNHKMRPLTEATFSIIRWPYKLIVYRGYKGFEDVVELYNLENDPEELNNLSQKNIDTVSDLKVELDYNLALAEKKVLVGY